MRVLTPTEVALTDKLRAKLAELGHPVGDAPPEVIVAAAIQFKAILRLSGRDLKKLDSLTNGG